MRPVWESSEPLPCASALTRTTGLVAMHGYFGEAGPLLSERSLAIGNVLGTDHPIFAHDPQQRVKIVGEMLEC